MQAKTLKMTEMNEQSIRIEGTVSKSWLSQKVGNVFDHAYYFDPEKRHEVDRICRECVQEHIPGLNVFFGESNLSFLEYAAPEKVFVGGIQPNMILGMLLGAEFVPYPDRDADIKMSKSLRDKLQVLPDPETLLNHELIKMFDAQLEKYVHESSRIVVPPFFWDHSGMAAIHGPITTAQKLLGERIFMDMLIAPLACQRLLEWIVEAYICLISHFAQYCSFDFHRIHIGECSGCMIAKEQFEAFGVSMASRLGAVLGPIRYHSCGNSSHLLEAIYRIENIAAIDLGGETDLARARRIFGRNFHISIAPMPANMSSRNNKAILIWARMILQANKGGPLTIIYHLEPGYNLETLYCLQDMIENEYAVY